MPGFFGRFPADQGAKLDLKPGCQEFLYDRNVWVLGQIHDECIAGGRATSGFLKHGCCGEFLLKPLYGAWCGSGSLVPPRALGFPADPGHGTAFVVGLHKPFYPA